MTENSVTAIQALEMWRAACAERDELRELLSTLAPVRCEDWSTWGGMADVYWVPEPTVRVISAAFVERLRAAGFHVEIANFRRTPPLTR